MCLKKLPAYGGLILNLSLKFVSSVYHQTSFQSVFSFNQPCRDFLFFCTYKLVADRIAYIDCKMFAGYGSHLAVCCFLIVVVKRVIERQKASAYLL